MARQPEQPNAAQPWCALHEDKIDNLWHAVFGNGKPGLVSRMDRMESKMDTAVSLLRWQIGIMVAIGVPVVLWILSHLIH